VAIPDFQTMMRPLLTVLVDGHERPVANIREALAEQVDSPRRTDRSVFLAVVS
jgi:restriction endonuclease Mrr